LLKELTAGEAKAAALRNQLKGILEAALLRS
jgi:hypothetical protein